MINLIKTSLNVCGPCKYRINTINKKHLNIARCRINPKKVRLENIHVISWVLLKGLKAQSTLEKTWAWVGQVDLFWTNIGEK